MRVLHFWRILLLTSFLAALTGTGRAQLDTKDLLVPKLVADTSTVAPGKPFTVGLLLKMKPGWHTYWEFPGDAGAALNVDWQLPAGYEAGPLQYPLPKWKMEEGDLLAFLYEDEVMVMAQITPPAQLPPGEQSLKAKLRWLVCEKSCIPGQGSVELTLAGGDTPAPANAELFAKWRGQLPKQGAPFPVKWDTSNPKEVQVTVSGVGAEQKLQFFPLPPEGAMPEHPSVSEPGADGRRTVKVPLSAPGAGTWRGLLVAQSGEKPREGWIVSATDKGEDETVASPAAGPVPKQGLALMLGLAFLGGLLLNVMPCVLPVIALKIFGFVNQAGHEPKRVQRLGFAFVAGVLTFFLGLATAVAALGSAFHWGFQFSNPYVLVGLISLIFVFGLNLLGVFEITLSSETTSRLSDLSAQEGYQGAYLHGLFTTLLGTSCTAPLLGPALGYATTQPAAIVYLLFVTMAAGLSLPYLLLTSNPAWMKFLPKPGMWMERFKQIMGFVMLAVAIWLFTVYAGRGQEATESLTWFLFTLGVAAWIFGTLRNRLVGAIVALLLVTGGYGAIFHWRMDEHPVGTAKASGGWQPFTEEGLKSALAAKQPVLVDFTADWCLNCKFFERTVLSSDAVKNALVEKKVLTLRGDWTNQDPVITKYLNQFGRVGVPLYVLYRPGEAEPVVQDGLTRGGLLEELAKVK